MSNVNYSFKNKHDLIEKEVLKLTQSQRLACAAYAIATEQTPQLRALLKQIDHIDVPVNGNTLLMLAVTANNKVATHMLINEFGADANEMNQDGLTLAEYALKIGHLDICSIVSRHSNNAIRTAATPTKQQSLKM